MHLALSLILQLQAVGLQQGESFTQLAKAPPAHNAHAQMHGRVLDAFTGRPVAGAKVEVWSEEIDEVFGGYYRLGDARSLRDGRFTIQQQVGTIQAEKARISAPGYLTWSGVRGDLYDAVRLFKRMPLSPRLRVLDLVGQPIAGARITSTMTCAHDAPAFDVRTGPDGIVSLGEYGLQDDVQELRIRAQGHQALKYVDGEPMFAGVYLGKPYDVHLPRQRPVRIRILERDGDAASNRPITINDGDGYHVVRPDKHGVLELTNRYHCDELSLQFTTGDKPRHIAYIHPPAGRMVTLRSRAEDWPEKTATGTVRLDLTGLKGKSMPRVQLFHEAGWLAEIEDKEGVSFPVGKGLVMIGGAFTGWEQEIHEFEIQAGKAGAIEAGMDVVIQAQWKPEPEIQVATPKDGEWRLLVQAGADTHIKFPFDTATPVPGNREIVLCLQGEGKRLIKTLEFAKPGMKVDFAKELAGLATAASKPDVVEQDIRLFSAKTGKPLSGELSIRYGQDCLQEPAGEKPAAHFQIRGPVGNAWLARFEAPGHSPIYLRGILQHKMMDLTPKVEALASLEIQAPFQYEIVGDDALDLDALPPGPLGLVLQLENGRRYGLNIALAPGAKRIIQIR